MTDAPSPPLVLVVEDHLLLRMQAVALLEEAGFETLEAPDADAALSILRQRSDHVTVLFTDIEMPPGKSGLELAQQVHDSWPNVLLLVTSGRLNIADADLPDHGKFLSKPYLAPDVVSKIRAMLSASTPSG